MRVALGEAAAARVAGEVPIGAAILRDGVVIGRAHNETVTRRNPTSHAELLARGGLYTSLVRAQLDPSDRAA